MTESAAEVVTVIAATPKEIWNALTDPDLVRQYFFGATVESDWKAGGPITWSGMWEGKPFEDKGEILAADEERQLTFSHWSPMAGSDDAPENYHVVDIILTPNTDGTRVTLVQTNLVGGITDSDRAHRAEFEKNWSTVLEGLKRTSEG